MSTANLIKQSKFLIDNPTLSVDDISGEPKSKHAFINKLNQFGDKFLYSRLYMVLLGLLVFVCWYLEKEIVGVAIVIFFAFNVSQHYTCIVKYVVSSYFLVFTAGY